MKTEFQTQEEVAVGKVLIMTNPEHQKDWPKLEQAINGINQTVTAINAVNNRKIQIPVQSIISIESEDRMCNLKLENGNMYLYGKRLKYAEVEFRSNRFMRINNQTLINLNHVAQFTSSVNARIQLLMKDGTTYIISRHYIKEFRRALSC
ncbi:LytTR family DNA-binding domain-containing protein [Enterococcus sp. LJL128]|uniref:LytTR family DNA-binding domain-containing protein n=1 Tax=Enterococcus sp. LJL51 TaxID=3416656 RepID=UPI003CECF4E7